MRTSHLPHPCAALPRLALVTALLLPCGVTAQQELAEYDIETVPVAEGIYMLVGPGGNIGLSVGEDGTLMIDALYSVLMGKILAAIGEVGDPQVRYLINTHYHFDHADGNVALGEAGVTIIAHENSGKNFVGDQALAFIQGERDIMPEAGRPTLTFTKSLTLHMNGEEIVAYHPGPTHTDGDLIVHFKNADVVHMGDIFFSAGYPYIDIYHGGSIDLMIATVDKVLKWVDEDTKIIPGHGPLSDRAGLARYREMLATVRERVAQRVEEGMSGDEIVAAQPTADLDEEWAQGMPAESFVRLVHATLAEGG
jgi:glyoxylase-like metal-dependent hydrolase (beta-lactamase superfamily II)